MSIHGVTPAKVDWLTACSGKERFSTHSVAMKVANRKRKNGKRRRYVTIYKCEGCGFFHLGTDAMGR